MSRQVTRQQQKARTRVFVGLSGGVDSAVSAALLKKAGYDIMGVFIKVWQPDWLECTWKEDRRDAMRVAAKLGIPFVTLDLVKEYKKGVIDYMLAEYKDGRTPNPDVMCNREVKFGAFWKWAKRQGADYIATGHYARIADGKMEKKKEGRFLLKGIDPNKDQSYFLWTLNQKDLGHILFPVGHLIKPEVRKLARRFNLPNAEKKDSQGLCFIGKIDVKDFLAHYIHAKRGAVIDEKGQIIGTHPGALLFTIGERHGFTITEKGTHDAPYYVTDKNMRKNTITVSSKHRGSLAHSSMEKVSIMRVNWVGEVPKRGRKLQARGRYRQILEDITIDSATPSRAAVAFKRPQDTLTPGQSLVVYNNVECVGGGVIK